MLFMIHPNQYLPETGYLLCGAPVVLTADGAEVLHGVALLAEGSPLTDAARFNRAAMQILCQAM